MKFNDGGEVDDKVIGVLADDKRMDHAATNNSEHTGSKKQLLLGTL